MSLIIDSSAVIAIFFGEPEEDAYLQAIASAQTPVMHALAHMDAARQMLARNQEALGMLEEWTSALNIEIAPLTMELSRKAARAGRELGQGRLLDARLMSLVTSLALARDRNQPLLAKNRLTDPLPEIWKPSVGR